MTSSSSSTATPRHERFSDVEPSDSETPLRDEPRHRETVDPTGELHIRRLVVLAPDLSNAGPPAPVACLQTPALVDLTMAEDPGSTLLTAGEGTAIVPTNADTTGDTTDQRNDLVPAPVMTESEHGVADAPRVPSRPSRQHKRTRTPLIPTHMVLTSMPGGLETPFVVNHHAPRDPRIGHPAYLRRWNVRGHLDVPLLVPYPR